MEYDELVNFYKQKLQERYRQCTENPDKRKLMELIQRADGETISRVAALLEEDVLLTSTKQQTGKI